MTEFSGRPRRDQPAADGSSGALITEQVVQQTQETASQVAQQVQQRATSMLDGQKQRAVDGLTAVSEAMRQSSSQVQGQDLGPVSQIPDKVADQMESISGYLSKRSIDQLIGDIEQFGRERPALLLGGAFILGVGIARFLKSSSAAASTQSGSFPAGYSRATTPYRYDAEEGVLTNAPAWQREPEAGYGA